MTHQPGKPSPNELEALYRTGRDAEPEPGLDRIIRARAEQATKSVGLTQPTRWLGGVATAAALVLVIGVTLQQREPETVRFEEAFQAPAPAAMRRQEPAAALAPTAERPMSSDSSGYSEPAEAVAEARQRSRAPAASVDIEDGMGQLEPARWLDQIQRLVKQGRLEEAREQLEQFQNQFPETDIPDTIDRPLAEPESD